MHQPRTSGDQRGEVTKTRILDTAVEVFAVMGYEGASTRQLAAEAGVNQPAIQYHFTSKEGLYCAAVERIATDIEDRMRQAREAIEHALVEPVDEAGLITSLMSLLDAFADMVLEQHDSEHQGLFIARAELENSAMLEPMGDVIVASIIRPCARALARLMREDEQTGVLRALAIIGQTMNFKNKCLGGLIRHKLGLGEFDEPTKIAVKSMIREHTLAILSIAGKNKA